MRSPAGLGDAGKKLWRSIDDVFDFTEEPGKVHILTQACRVSDIIAELDEAADEAPLTVMGSMGQPVISPFIAEARLQRALLAQLYPFDWRGTAILAALNSVVGVFLYQFLDRLREDR